jgi:MocE subfamily Rieske [2Fe-2S] domain protein
MSWISAIEFIAIEVEGIARFDHAGRTYAIYRTAEDAVYCTDGLCSHEAVHLCDGLLDGHEIECPKHSGLFDIRTGEAKALPACVNLKTWPARINGTMVEIDI